MSHIKEKKNLFKVCWKLPFVTRSTNYEETFNVGAANIYPFNQKQALIGCFQLPKNNVEYILFYKLLWQSVERMRKM